MKNSLTFCLLIGALLLLNGWGSALDNPKSPETTLTLRSHSIILAL